MVAIQKSTSKSKSSEESRRFFSKLCKFVLIIVAFLVYLFLVPLLVILASPLYLYRGFVILLAKIFRPDIIGIMSTRDGVVGLDDVTQKCECMLNLLLVYDGEPDINLIRTKFQETVMDAKGPGGESTYAKFKYYYEFWLGFAFWKEKRNFKLEKHIRFCEDTECINQNNNNNDPSDKINFTMEEELLRLLGPLSARTFAPEVPPWEILIVKNYIPAPAKVHSDFVPIVSESGDDVRKWALIMRVHHALGDGYSLMKMILNNWSAISMDKIPQAPIRNVSFLTTFLMYAGIIVLSPYYHLRQFLLDVDRNIWHLKESKLTRESFTTVSEKISLKTLKEIGISQGVSTTAVLLSGFAGAIRKFLKETGQEKKIPEVMRGLSPMPWKGHPMNGLVNHWTLGTMVFPVGLDCPRKRMKAAEKSIRLLKRSPILFTNFGTVPLLTGLPTALTNIFATNWMTTFIQSNFSGLNDLRFKSFENYWASDVCFWLPQLKGTASMGVAFMSYNGAMRITMNIDKAIVPEQASSVRFNDLLNQEFKSLQSLKSSSNATSV